MKALPAVASVFTLLLVSTAILAAPCGVNLMHPHSFDGWNYGPKPITGWTVKDGKFSGTAGGVELLSGFSADCGELYLEWKVENSSKLQIRMPEAPAGKGLTLTLCEGEGCGRLTDGDKVLNPGVLPQPKEQPKEEAKPEKKETKPEEKEEAKPAQEKAEDTKSTKAEETSTAAPKQEKPKTEPKKTHTVAVLRADGKIAVTVDGKKCYELPLDTTRRFGLALFVEAGKAEVWNVRGSEPLGELIFNGKDLTGWRDDAPGSWVVENGELVLKPGAHQWLRSIKDYENFTISFEYKLKKGGNSGLAIRTPRIGWPSNDGFEMQLFDDLDPNHLVKDSLMSSYSNVPPICRADKPGNEAWKKIVVKTDGWMISAWINGHLVQQFNTRFHPELRYRQLRGWIGFQDHSDWVRFRNIRLREAPNGESLQAWYAHPDPNGTTILVDRLMNSEFLATDQKLRSSALSMNVDAPTPGEYVLADLRGPGVLTQLALSRETDGKLSFYIDGQKQPKITCKPSELPKYLPRVNHRHSPLATMLCYEKSLKIVAKDCRRVDSRIEYVTMPKNHPIQSFVSLDETGIPRGWQVPPVFRSFRIHWGTFHAYDPGKTVRTPEKKLDPGKSEAIIHFDGAGTMKYLKLLGDRSLLQSDDLWIEVRYDRESSPAISAPARFWLPSLIKQGGFHNFLFRNYYGLTSHLGIPFGDGLTISLVNRGKKPIERVGLEASAITDATQPVGPMRLRGQYLPAGQKSDVLFEHQGQGRLIGMVLDAPKGATPGIARLEVDATRVPGWASSDLAPLLGSAKTNFADMTSGNRDGMAWRYLLLAPVDFQKSIKLQGATKNLPSRLMLYYAD